MMTAERANTFVEGSTTLRTKKDLKSLKINERSRAASSNTSSLNYYNSKHCL